MLNDPESVSELVSKVEAWRANQLTVSQSFESLFAAVRARSWEQMAGEMLDLIFA